MYDTIIRGGTVYDGTGAEPVTADVAIADGRIVEVGRVSGTAKRTLDADGLMVTPGFVDIHTHYDGHVTWTDRLQPSSQHGVTTVVTGNCGVGFAPCRPRDRDELIRLMEGVEDIPGVVLSEGLTWEWETFPEFLDAVERRPHDVDIAIHLPHAALRVYVMGERAIRREAATPEDNAAMAELARLAAEAGAVGFSTSRNLSHKTKAGESIPTHGAVEDELKAIALGVRAAGRGVLEMSADFGWTGDAVAEEIGLYKRLVKESGLPLSMAIAFLNDRPDLGEVLVREVDAANAEGLEIKIQSLGRPVGVLQGFELSMHPFTRCPSYQAIADLPLAQRLQALAQADVRARIVQEAKDPANQTNMGRKYASLYLLGDPPNYEPRPEESVAGRAAASGAAPEDVLYELMLNGAGRGYLYTPLTNYGGGDFAELGRLIRNDNVLLGLGDAGAHVGLICDASQPTFMLAHWGRDRASERIPLTALIKALTATNARALGFADRGVIAPGYKADVNLIDLPRLGMGAPRACYDLPAGGRRLTQDATGYVATLVSGEVSYQDGEATGVLAGRLIRGGRAVA